MSVGENYRYRQSSSTALSLASIELLLCASIIIFFSILIRYLKYIQQKKSNDEISIDIQIKDKEMKISTLSKVSDFVQVSLLERSVIKLKKELDLYKSKREKQIETRDYAAIVGNYIRPLVLLLLIITFWSTPLISGFPIYSIGPGSSLLLSLSSLPVPMSSDPRCLCRWPLLSPCHPDRSQTCCRRGDSKCTCTLESQEIVENF